MAKGTVITVPFAFVYYIIMMIWVINLHKKFYEILSMHYVIAALRLCL